MRKMVEIFYTERNFSVPMLKRRVAAVLAILISTTQSNGLAAKSLPEISVEATTAVVYISFKYTDQTTAVKEGFASGVLVSGDGDVLTTYESIRRWNEQSDSNKAAAPLFGQIGSSESPIKMHLHVIAFEPSTDIALLKLSDTSSLRAPAPVCYAKPPIGALIHALGFSGGPNFKPISGNFAGESSTSSAWTGVFVFEAGMSGAPIYNEAGKVVGLVQRGDAVAPTTTDIVPIQRAKSMLANNTSVLENCASSQTQNGACREVPFTDNSKFPPITTTFLDCSN